MVLVVRYCTTSGNEAHVNNQLNLTMFNDSATMYKTFAFLYGTIPTAPTVLVYSSKYNFGEEIVRKCFVEFHCYCFMIVI